MKPLRLLCIAQDLTDGGCMRKALTFLNHLRADEFRVELCLLKGGGTLGPMVPASAVSWTAVAAGKSLAWRSPFVLTRIVRRARQADLVLGLQEGSSIYAAAFAGALAGRPSAGWITVAWSRLLPSLHWWHRLVWRNAYRRTRLLLTVSRGVAEDLVALDPPLTRVVRPTVDPLPLALVESQSRAPLPPEFEVLRDGHTILTVGRLVPQKALDDLLRAFAIVCRTSERWRLVIVGDGGERAALEALAASLGIASRVVFAGHQPNPYPFFRASRLFVLSSRFEGLGIVLVEALLLGLPVISTDRPVGPREVLRDGRFGTLVPTGDPEALASAMLERLSEPAPDEAGASPGRARAQEYDPAAATRIIEEVLRDIAHRVAGRNG